MSDEKFIPTTRFEIPDAAYVLRDKQSQWYYTSRVGEPLYPVFDQRIGPLPTDEAIKLKTDLNMERMR